MTDATHVTEEMRNRYAVYLGDELIYRPQAKQYLLHACEKENVLYGGAVAGGKSHGLRWHGILGCLGIPNFRALLLRREFKDLENTHLISVSAEVPEELAKYSTGRKRLEFPSNGSLFQFGHCNTDLDFASWLSTEWDLILIDEASLFTPYMLYMLKTRLRTTKPGVTPQFVQGSNPGGPAHLYLKARYLDKEVPPEEDETYDPEDYAFIQALVADNEFIDPGYKKRLDGLPEEERRAYRDGDWDVFAGQYFKQLRRGIHGRYSQDWVLSQPWFAEAKKFRSYDWGFAKPASFGWWVLDPEGNLYRYREHYVAGEEVEDFMAEVLHASMGDQNRPPEIYEYTVADPACWDIAHGPSKAERAHLTGVPMIPAERGDRGKRTSGWSMMRRLIDPKCLPMLYVVPECRHWWRTVPTLVHANRKVEDLDTNGEDHAADETRYLIMSRPDPSFLSLDEPLSEENPHFPGSGSYHALEYIKNLRPDKVVAPSGNEEESVLPMHPEFGRMY